MACSSCHLFGGPICASCRTLRRIRELLQGGHLLKSQEAAVVQALRGAAGALVDLAEEAGPVLRAERETSGALETAEEKTEVGSAGAGASKAPVEDKTEGKDFVTKEEEEDSKGPVAEIVVQDEEPEAGKESEDKPEVPEKPKKEKKRRKRQEGSEKKERKRDRKKKPQRKEESEGHYSVEEPEEADKKKAVSSSSTSSSLGDDGRKPRLASQKGLLSLYRGTGLDPRERVRKRVARRARKQAKRAKSDRSSSSSRTGSDEESSVGENFEDVELFEADSRLKKLPDAFPGALCCQSVKMMRQNLLQSIGEDFANGSATRIPELLPAAAAEASLGPYSTRVGDAFSGVG